MQAVYSAVVAALRAVCEAEREYAASVAEVCVAGSGAGAVKESLQAAVECAGVPDVEPFARLVALLCVSAEFRRRAGELGVQAVLLYALRVERTGGLTVALFCAVAGLLAGCDGNKRLFCGSGGVEVVMARMSEHGGDAAVVEQGCKVLDLAADGQNVTTDMLLEDRITPAEYVKQAMLNHPDVARLQEYGCSLLIKIASVSESDTAQLNRCGVMTAVEVAILKHGADASVASLGNQLLALLKSDRYGRSTTRERSADGSRFRSRSRTLGERSRSKKNRSASPSRDRKFSAGRLAMLQAKAGGPGMGLPKKAASCKIDMLEIVME